MFLNQGFSINLVLTNELPYILNSSVEWMPVSDQPM